MVHEDSFEWILNISTPYENGTFDIKTKDIKSKNKQYCIIDNSMCNVNSSSGSYQRNTLINNPLFLGTFNISHEYMQTYILRYKKDSHYILPSNMIIKLSII